MTQAPQTVEAIDTTPIIEKLDAAIAEGGHGEQEAEALEGLAAAAKDYRAVYGVPTPRTINHSELAEGQVVVFVSNRDYATHGGRVTSLTRDEDGVITDLVINHGRVRYLSSWLTEHTTIIVHKNAPVVEPAEAGAL